MRRECCICGKSGADHSAGGENTYCFSCFVVRREYIEAIRPLMMKLSSEPKGMLRLVKEMDEKYGIKEAT
jgi:hypothetical protein